MTGAGALRAALPRLVAAGVPGAARDLRLLLAHATGVPADRLTLTLDDSLSAAAFAAFEAAVAARAARQPVSQIIGYRLFWGRSFRVTPDVLDPRPETETLVAAALDGAFDRVLDLGTGSGAILLSLLADRPVATGTGTDLSAAALAVASANAGAFGLTDRVTFVQSDWFGTVSGSYDLIVANPPYIAEAELPGLAPEVRNWEPRMALISGADGLDAYRQILRGVRMHLTAQGRAVLEIGASQGAAVTGLCHAAGLHRVTVIRDMDGRDRVICAFRDAG
jgi:release factor glutamine methyltransferase